MTLILWTAAVLCLLAIAAALWTIVLKMRDWLAMARRL